MPQTKTTIRSRNKTKVTWSETQVGLRTLMEEELHGLLQYLRSIHYLAVGLMLASLAALVYGISVLFQNDHQAVVAFLVMAASSFTVSLTCLWALQPWVLPRFLLPMDMNGFDIDELKALFNDPEEYLKLLKTHIQVLTDQFLLPKLSRLRNAIALFLFGMATSVILSIALP